MLVDPAKTKIFFVLGPRGRRRKKISFGSVFLLAKNYHYCHYIMYFQVFMPLKSGKRKLVRPPSVEPYLMPR